MDGMSLGGVRAPDGQRPDAPSLDADWNVVSPEYFATLRIPIVAGRGFTASDRVGAPLVAVINESLARRLWPGQDPVGRQFEQVNPDDRQFLQVIGVTRDGKYRSLDDVGRSFVYVAVAQQRDWSRLNLLVRARPGIASASLVPAVRRLVRDLNVNLPIITMHSLEEYIGIALLPQRLAAGVSGSLGMVGILLAAIGVYGVTAYAAARRTREIGIRVALGAQRADVMRLVVRRGVTLTLAGTAIGLASAAALTRLLSDLLFGVGPTDVMAFTSASLVLLIVASVATCIPAYSAARLEPMKALKYRFDRTGCQAPLATVCRCRSMWSR